MKQKKKEVKAIFDAAMADIRLIEDQVISRLDQAESDMHKPLDQLNNLPDYAGHDIPYVDYPGFCAQWDQRRVLWLNYPSKEEWARAVIDGCYEVDGSCDE